MNTQEPSEKVKLTTNLPSPRPRSFLSSLFSPLFLLASCSFMRFMCTEFELIQLPACARLAICPVTLCPFHLTVTFILFLPFASSSPSSSPSSSLSLLNSSLPPSLYLPWSLLAPRSVPSQITKMKNTQEQLSSNFTLRLNLQTQLSLLSFHAHFLLSQLQFKFYSTFHLARFTFAQFAIVRHLHDRGHLHSGPVNCND